MTIRPDALDAMQRGWAAYATDQEELAGYYCRKGDHFQAGQCYIEAADWYDQAGWILEAARATRLAFKEAAEYCPAPPVNVRALVD